VNIQTNGKTITIDGVAISPTVLDVLFTSRPDRIDKFIRIGDGIGVQTRFLSHGELGDELR
jgi:hypothetical protein